MAIFGVFLLGSALFTLVNAASYPHLKRVDCDKLNPGYQCTEATECRSIAVEISSGRKPIVCGWNGDVPRVCCQEESGDKTGVPLSKWSWISPEGCGVRFKPKKPNVPPTGIQRRSLPDDFFPGDEYGERPRLVSQNGSVSSWEVTVQRYDAVGGVSVRLEWPWMVAIFAGSSTRPMCGGVLIDERHILTAAHCFAEGSLDPKDYKVLIGKFTLNPKDEKFEIDVIKVHEGYDDCYYYYDIAILRLTRPQPDTAPACLPVNDELKPGDLCVLLGWGDLSFRGSSSTNLQEVAGLPLIPTEQCDAQYKRVSRQVLPRGITHEFVCAGLNEGGKDACQGDSGGPLLHLEPESNVWEVIGIVSFGYGCAEPGFPGVYTKISAHTPWIEDYIERESQFDARNSEYTVTRWWDYFKSQKKPS